MVAFDGLALLLALLVVALIFEPEWCQIVTQSTISIIVGVTVHTLEVAVSAARQVRQAGKGECLAAAALWVILLLLGGREDSALCPYNSAWYGSAVLWLPAYVSSDSIFELMPSRIRRVIPAIPRFSLTVFDVFRSWSSARMRSLLVRKSVPGQHQQWEWMWIDASQEHSLEELFAHLDGDNSGKLEPREARHLSRVFPALKGNSRAHRNPSKETQKAMERNHLPRSVESFAALAKVFTQETGTDVVTAGPSFGRYYCGTSYHRRLGWSAEATSTAETTGPVCRVEAISAVDRVGMLAVPLVATPICVLGPSALAGHHFESGAMAHAQGWTAGAAASVGCCLYTAAIVLAAAGFGWKSRSGARIRRAALQGMESAAPILSFTHEDSSRLAHRRLQVQRKKAAAIRAALCSALISGLIVCSIESRVCMT